MLPPWMLFHIPHDATHIPESVKPQFCLSESELESELLLMTDLHTFDLFCGEIAPSQVVRTEVSRLVIDVERFSDDEREPMASNGMGMVYTRTHDGGALRHPIDKADQDALVEAWYAPHHAKLNALTQSCLNEHGKALIVDGHSFASQALPYEQSTETRRPQICIGTHKMHTPGWLVDALEDGFWQQGYSVGINHPFSGCMVPAAFHSRDPRVMSVMIEVRKDLYLDELTGQKSANFERTAQAIRSVLMGLPD